MTIGLIGRRRHGKSLMMTILGLYFSTIKNVPLYSNSEIETSKIITLKQLVDINTRNCVICLDEFWKKMDSWDWKNPISRFITHWYQLQGHRDIILLYTTQLLSQINNRIRESTDYFIYCQKYKKEYAKEYVYEFKFTFFDGFTMEKLFTLKTNENKVKPFYDYYNYIGYTDSLMQEYDH